MRSLFVSFTGLLYALDKGEVSQEQLDNGLFFFGCGRNHAVNPGAEGEFSEVKNMAGLDDGLTHRGNDPRKLHQQLVEALLKAEADGRVEWRVKYDGYREDDTPLRELLQKNGLEAPVFEHMNYPFIREQLRGIAKVVS